MRTRESSTDLEFAPWPAVRALRHSFTPWVNMPSDAVGHEERRRAYVAELLRMAGNLGSERLS